MASFEQVPFNPESYAVINLSCCGMREEFAFLGDALNEMKACLREGFTANLWRLADGTETLIGRVHNGKWCRVSADGWCDDPNCQTCYGPR